MTEPADHHNSVVSKVEQFEDQQVQTDDDRVILVFEKSRSFFHPGIKRTLLCELPKDGKTEGEDQVGELLKTMYGTRDGSAEWDGCFSEVVEGANTGLISLGLFLQEQTKLTA